VIPTILAPIADVLHPIPSILDAIGDSAVVAAIPHVFTPVADVLSTIPNVLSTIMAILQSIARPAIRWSLGAGNTRGEEHKRQNDRGQSGPENHGPSWCRQAHSPLLDRNADGWVTLPPPSRATDGKDCRSEPHRRTRRSARVRA
jgi:hypothetical protein